MSNELMKEKLWKIEQLQARIAELEAEKRSAAEEIEKAIDERNTLEQQAQKRLAPQKTQVIKPIVVDYNRYGAVPRSGDDIVFTMRQGNKVEQFGNPFSSGKGNTIRVGSVKESVDSYIRWLSDSEAEFTDVNGKIHKHVLPERRAWILDQIDSGRLDGKKLVYYKQPDVEGGKYYSHADALADFVAARRTNTTTTLTDRPQGGADE